MQHKLKSELLALAESGKELLLSELCRKTPAAAKNSGVDCTKFTKNTLGLYQAWYTLATRAMRKLAPERLSEFVGCYEPDAKRKDFNAGSFRIKDYLQGFSSPLHGFDTFSSFFAQFQHQVQIFEAVVSSADDRIFNIQETLQADLFDQEIGVSKELLDKKHLRAAGAIAGVVLERHLKGVCEKNSIPLQKKKASTIADLNDALKADGRVDVPMWRLIQRLADIRNMAVHAKERAPTQDEISDLISGASKVIAEVS